MATTSVLEVVMPQMGVSVSEGTITKWLKQVGETIERDESLLEISTDKVDTEVPSPGTGVVQEILVKEGETVDVGTKLATIAPEGAVIVWDSFTLPRVTSKFRSSLLAPCWTTTEIVSRRRMWSSLPE